MKNMDGDGECSFFPIDSEAIKVEKRTRKSFSMGQWFSACTPSAAVLPLCYQNANAQMDTVSIKIWHT